MQASTGLFCKTVVAVLFIVIALPMAHAQQEGDLDAYKWRLTTMWWYSHPSGSFRASDDQVAFDIHRDFDFTNYSTFSGGIDWRFKRKHHLIFNTSPVYSTRTNTLTRDITFRGVTYHVGAKVTADINSLSFAPGYQWDFLRRRQGYLALATACNLLNTSATLKGEGTINDVGTTRTASGSILAPLPIVGTRGRWYQKQNSARFSIDGNFEGMYFFGYGNFIYTAGTVQFAIRHNLNLTGGYQMGSRLKITGTNDRLGLRMVQVGPLAGLEASW